MGVQEAATCRKCGYSYSYRTGRLMSGGDLEPGVRIECDACFDSKMVDEKQIESALSALAALAPPNGLPWWSRILHGVFAIHFNFYGKGLTVEGLKARRECYIYPAYMYNLETWFYRLCYCLGIVNALDRRGLAAIERATLAAEERFAVEVERVLGRCKCGGRWIASKKRRCPKCRSDDLDTKITAHID